MRKRVMKFLNEEKVVYHKQHGFRKGFSTVYAIISLIDNVEITIDNNQFVCGVFIGFQKAFDTVYPKNFTLKITTL